MDDKLKNQILNNTSQMLMDVVRAMQMNNLWGPPPAEFYESKTDAEVKELLDDVLFEFIKRNRKAARAWCEWAVLQVHAPHEGEDRGFWPAPHRQVT